MKRLLILLIAATTLLASCSKGGSDNPPQPAKTERALLFVFVGTSLQMFFDDNLTDAMSAMSADVPGASGRIAALRRADGKWRIDELAYNRRTKQVETTTLKVYEGLNRTEAASITEILLDMMHLVPADRYGLIFGGHGSGWLPKGTKMRSTAEYNLWQELPATYKITRQASRAFGEGNTCYDIEEIADALAATKTTFDYIAFDDCFMSNIESLYSLRRCARYIIASPCEVMGKGMPYHRIIPILFNAKLTLEQQLTGLCKAYYNYYLSEYDPTFASGCIALTRCDELEGLATATRRLLAEGMAEGDRTQLQSYEGLSSHLFYDFGQYMKQVASSQPSYAAFTAQLDRTFPVEARLHTPEFYSSFNDNLNPISYYSGVTTGLPAERFTTECRATAWWRAVLP